MEKELSTLDQYLTDPSWGKSNIKETNNRKNQTKSFDG